MKHFLSTAADEQSSANIVPFVIHSTYRHKRTGELLKPSGLQWNLPGCSHVTYVALNDSSPSRLCDIASEPTGDEVKSGIVEAHNRWSFARGETFAHVDDIKKVAVGDNGQHVTVEWKDSLRKRIFAEDGFGSTIADLLKKDAEAIEKDPSTVQVWINGCIVGHLRGPSSLPPILEALEQVTSRHLAYQRSDCGRMIRIERYFGGYLRQKNDIFEHIVDNLIAMEDIELLDEATLIGNAKLEDWIMGGTLTSRLWVQEMDDRIRFLRPLYNDDITTSDRKFELLHGTDDDKIALVKDEMHRLRQLAALDHPFVPESKVDEDPLEDVRKRLRENRPRRKFFGM